MDTMLVCARCIHPTDHRQDAAVAAQGQVCRRCAEPAAVLLRVVPSPSLAKTDGSILQQYLHLAGNLETRRPLPAHEEDRVKRTLEVLYAALTPSERAYVESCVATGT